MNKKFLLLGLVFAIILGFNLASVYAWDSYSDWYNNYWNTDSSPLYSGSYSTSSSHSPTYSSSQERHYVKSSTEYKQTTTTENQDPWNYEKTTTSVVVTDETERENTVPAYYNNYNSYYPRYYTNQNYNSGNVYYTNPSYDYNYNNQNFNNPGYNAQSFNDWCKQRGTPYTSWRYKNTYDGQPSYDPCLGYYNWRY